MLDQMNSDQVRADVERFLKRGVDLLKKGMNDEAQMEFKKALREDPNNREAKAYLDQLAGNATNEALVGQVRTVLRKGLELYQEDKIDEAVKVWEEALKLDPNSAQAKSYIKAAQERKIAVARAASLVANGVAAYQQGDLTTAVTLWEQALAADSHNEQAEQYLEEGRKQIKRREAEVEAKQHFVNGANFYQAGQVLEAGREWAWAIKILPDYAEAQEYLAQAKAYQAGQALPDIDPAGADAAAIQASYRNGADAFMSLKFKDAGAFFSQIKAKRPTHALTSQLIELSKQRQREYLDSYIAKGKLAQNAGNLSEAVTQWKLALKEAPDDAVSRQTLADAKPAISAEVEKLYAAGSEAFNQGNNKDAIHLFDRVIHFDPSHENAFKKREEAKEKVEKLKGILSQMKA
jgi:tetratricopeptide (TPR) repeat protein